MPEDAFEEVTEIKYRPEITERTDDEARRGLLEGEEFMVLEIQVIGMVADDPGTDSLTLDYIAACHQNALASPWMRETIRLFSEVCENTVMVLTNRVRTWLFHRIQQQEERDLCLYRMSAWLSMGDDGSERWSIRDRIDPAFEQEDLLVRKRADEARRLAKMIVMGQNPA